METKTKRNLAIWVIALLVILNLSSLGTIWYHRYQFKKERRIEQREPRFEGRRGDMSRRMRGMPPFIEKALDLSGEQKNTVDSIWNHYEAQRRDLEDSMNNNRVRMFDLMMEEDLDSVRYEELSAAQGALLGQLNDTMLQMNRTIRTNLNEEQRQALATKLKEMRHRAPQQRRQRIRK